MVVNIYDTANQLEKDLRETQEFSNLKEAFEALNNDEETKKLYDDFRLIQQQLQQKQMTGQELTEEETQQAQELSSKVSENEVLSSLIQAEQAISQVIDDINQIALKPIQELYQSQEEG